MVRGEGGVTTTTNGDISFGSGEDDLELEPRKTEMSPLDTEEGSFISFTCGEDYSAIKNKDSIIAEGKYNGDCMVRGEGEEKLIGECKVHQSMSGGRCEGLPVAARSRGDNIPT
ncbi:hypothetical protein L2E82_38194 [Cichorium intybus]|uniref:Uncharacterized protein n=1 Tax=Cichorium intybus TaxID=13427 RepID=A0ACB9AG90_CICIN|nr:hypothetical protein L2E82_38194 [Cichorium intybus]